MLYRIFAAAMAAGVLVAILVSVIEAYTTTPLIFEAEKYEALSAPDTHTPTPESTDQPWAPSAGFERFIFTVISNSVTGIASSLLVIVGLTIGSRKADLAKGVGLALGAFAAVTLAPVMGLAPELPGMPAADLQQRQIWWLATVALSAVGLGCLILVDAKTIKLLGIVLLVAPHVWGAPHPADPTSLIPATMAARFAAMSISISALFWVLIGVFSTFFFERFKGQTKTPPA